MDVVNSNDDSSNSSNYVFVVIESGRADLVTDDYSHFPFLKKVTNKWDYSGNTYAQFPNTLKSALQFLCNRVPAPHFGFEEYDEIVT